MHQNKEEEGNKPKYFYLFGSLSHFLCCLSRQKAFQIGFSHEIPNFTCPKKNKKIICPCKINKLHCLTSYVLNIPFLAHEVQKEDYGWSDH